MGRRPFKWQFAFRRRFWVNRCFFVDELSNWPTNNRKLIGTCTYHYYSISNWFSPHFEILGIFVQIYDFGLVSHLFVSLRLDWIGLIVNSFLSFCCCCCFCHFNWTTFLLSSSIAFLLHFYFELSSISLLCCSLSASLFLSLSDPFAVVDKPVLYHWFGSYARLSDMSTCCIDILINAHHWTMKLRC